VATKPLCALSKSRVGDPNRLHALRIGNGLNAVGSEFLRDFGSTKAFGPSCSFTNLKLESNTSILAVRSVIRGV